MRFRATVCVKAESDDEVVAFDDWLDAWKEKMSFISGDYGDGVVHLFDLEGPEEAIAALPDGIRCDSKYADVGEKSGNPTHDIVPQR